MADDVSLFRNRAAAENANAESATLTNVRERSERAAKAWTEMADRAERITIQRHEREAQTAARIAGTE